MKRVCIYLISILFFFHTSLIAYSSDPKEFITELVNEAINKLSPAYKAVFNLYVLEEYTHKEIAEILGVSEGTSKSNLSKAKLNLQRILSEKFMNID